MSKPKFEVVDDLPGRAIREEPVDWPAVKKALVDNEGKWVNVAQNVASSISGQLASGKNQLFRGEELAHFEFRIKRPADADYPPRRTDLWGRYTS
jgi:hypothetical protein